MLDRRCDKIIHKLPICEFISKIPKTVEKIMFLSFVQKNIARAMTGAFLIGVAFSSGCASFEGEYSDPNKAEIVDDRWNETDARVTSEQMVNGLLTKYWLSSYKERNAGKRPLVIVGDVQNRTDEHIDTKALSEYITDELINSGKVRFVDAANREKILNEIQYQNESGMVSEKTAKRKGRQVGADFLLTGSMTASVTQWMMSRLLLIRPA